MRIVILALMGCITSAIFASVPPNPLIQGIEWAPTNIILKLAPGSDNWPMAWAGDDAIYTAYGDGQGFEPFHPEKLSLGFAKITGNPPEIRGKNLRAPILEQKGDGAAGRKASGILSVEGVIYLWARNAGNSQLAWSSDHGAMWTWSAWKFTKSFGCPTFLNFGRNYSGARDDFVYVYSPDANSAYELASRYVLARVPKQRIRNRDAYEFFVRIDAAGQPVWSKEIEERGGIFPSVSDGAEARCYRASVTYNSGLKRYLLVQPVPLASSKDRQGKIDTRFRAGLAIYDAPEPWGPWTTVFTTNEWDVGPGDSASFPTKWMSADGRTLHLVFSGNDSFSVRTARLRTTAAPDKSPAWETGITLANGWPTATPESQGLDPGKLEALWADLEKRHTHALLIIRNDRVLFERYAAGYTRTKPHGTASLAKALVGGSSLMLAMDDGRIQSDDLVSKFIPQWEADSQKKRITISQLATHTSGVEDAEADNLAHDQLTGWKGDFWQRPPPPRDPFTLARDVAPIMETPGTRARYSNPGMGLLAYCVTASLRGSTNADIRSLLKNRLLDPLGVPSNEWSIGYGQSVHIEGMDIFANWGGGSFSPNAAARIGRLMLRRGNWDGRRLVSPKVADKVTTHAGLPNYSGLCWWVNRRPDGTPVWPAAPGDAFWGAGAGHQFLLVVPSLNLIVVRNGTALESRFKFDDALEKYIVAPLMAAVKSDSRKL